MLILAGFSLAVLPLIFALINNALSIHEIATKSQRAVYNAVQATQNSRLLIEQLTSMERGARQYSILGDAELFSGRLDADVVAPQLRVRLMVGLGPWLELGDSLVGQRLPHRKSPRI